MEGDLTPEMFFRFPRELRDRRTRVQRRVKYAGKFITNVIRLNQILWGGQHFDPESNDLGISPFRWL